MSATTYPGSTSTSTIDDGKAAVAFLAVAAVDGLLLGLLTLVWILDPATAPSLRAVVATPLMALLTLGVAGRARRAVPGHQRGADLLVSTARWWSLFALLLAVPAILIVAAL